MYTHRGGVVTGRLLSHYELLEEIGKGGMGVVYRARDTRLDRIVAIKLLPPEKMSDPERKRRFVQEAKAASALNHPNIVTIHEIDALDGVDFIVMEYVEGTPLDRLIPEQGLQFEQVVGYALQIADALAAAHAAGIVHRDIKPGNIVVTNGGRVKVLDFGLAKLVERGSADDTTITAEAQTRAGAIVGTVAYASPEQIEGKPIDARSDVFSFGVVLYEMLTGRRPFHGESHISMMAAILRDTPQPAVTVRRGVPAEIERVVEKCLEKNREARYSSGGELRDDLAAIQERLAAKPGSVAAMLGQPVFAAAATLALVMVAVVTGWFGWRNSRTRWARNEALPAAERLVRQTHFHGAYRMLRVAERYIPDDPQLKQLRAAITRPTTIRTTPPRAEVFVKDYSDPDDPWESLGVTPIENVRIPFGDLRWRVVKAGYETLELANSFGEKDPTFRLEAQGAGPAGMVRVPAGSYKMGGADAVGVPEYWIDKYEVTNRQFKEFIEKGGYQKREYWKQALVEDGKPVAWDQAIAIFRDTTGRPGPSTWELGTYPEGQADFPVAGVSWYEAAAYAEFAGKALPTVHQWLNATDTGLFSDILRFSNFEHKGVARAGSFQGLGPFGTYDMAGNVKEWCWNAAGTARYLLGGAWNEPSYMFSDLDARPPFDRESVNGFRCVKYAGVLPATLTGAIERLYRDYSKEKPVSDAIYAAYRKMYAYDPAPLDARVESSDDSHPYWRKEKITFTAPYGNERVMAYLFLPKNATPPYQALVYHAGADAAVLPSSENLGVSLVFFEFAMRSGRAVLFPVYKGTYERQVAASGPNTEREVAIQAVKDASRSVDYLESRNDIDHARIGFYGLSWGANRGPRICAVESRFKTCVLMSGGFPASTMPAETDGINFAPRAHQALLMLNGRYDFDQSSEKQAKPMFRFWGAPEKDKRMVIFEAGHVPANLQDAIREILDWLDKYLGPVKTTG
ncbi:MAG TPA: protein kinase [Bryobacteraceae bacterium]|nr:protein kinase [Bryobacteraceae bacterium]